MVISCYNNDMLFCESAHCSYTYAASAIHCNIHFGDNDKKSKMSHFRKDVIWLKSSGTKYTRLEKIHDFLECFVLPHNCI